LYCCLTGQKRYIQLVYIQFDLIVNQIIDKKDRKATKRRRQHLYIFFNSENSYIILFFDRLDSKYKSNTNIISKFDSEIFYIF